MGKRTSSGLVYLLLDGNLKTSIIDDAMGPTNADRNKRRVTLPVIMSIDSYKIGWETVNCIKKRYMIWEMSVFGFINKINMLRCSGKN